MEELGQAFQVFQEFRDVHKDVRKEMKKMGWTKQHDKQLRQGVMQGVRSLFQAPSPQQRRAAMARAPPPPPAPKPVPAPAAQPTWNLEKVHAAEAARDFAALVSLVHQGNDVQKEHAAYALGKFCVDKQNRPSIASAGAIDAMVYLLTAGTHLAKDHAAIILRKLAYDDECERTIVAAGAVLPLVEMLRSGSDLNKTSSSAALVNLTFLETSASVVAASSVTPSLVDLVINGNSSQKTNAVDVLNHLALNELAREDIRTAGGIRALIDVLRDGTSEQATAALYSLVNLSKSDLNKTQIAADGGVDVLVTQVRSGHDDNQKQRAASVLAVLAEDDTNDVKIGAAGGVEALVELLRAGTEDQKNSAAWALSAVVDNVENRHRAVAAGGIEVLVSALCEGTAVQRHKAAFALHEIAQMEEYQASIGIPACVNAALALLREGDDNARDSAMLLMWNISSLNAERSMRVIEAGAMGDLVHNLANGPTGLRGSAAGVLRELAYMNPDQHTIMADLGVIELLLQALDMNDARLRTTSLGALLHLTRTEATRRRIISEGGIARIAHFLQTEDRAIAAVIFEVVALDSSANAELLRHNVIAAVVQMLDDDSIDIKVAAARVCWNITCNVELGETLVNEGVVEKLIDILGEEFGSEELDKSALSALNNLAANRSEVRLRIGEARGVPEIVACMKSEESEAIQLVATELLRSLGRCSDNRSRIDEAGGAQVLLEQLRKTSTQAGEFAIDAIAGLGVDAELRKQFVTGGAVDVLIQMISGPSTQCTKALFALASLAGDDASRATILEAGVLELALPLAKVELDCGVAATKVLSALAVDADGKAKLRGVEDVPSMMFDALDNGTESHMIYAAATLVRILDDDEATADKVAMMGGVEKLLTIASTQEGSLRKNALLALDNAFYSSKEAKKIAIEGGHVSLYVDLLKMSVEPDTIVYSLVNLSDQDGLAVAEAGAIPVLADYIRNEAASDRDCAVLALANIAYENDRLKAEVVATGLLPVFLDMMRKGSTVENAEAASILAILASDATIRPVITALTGITELCVELLKSDEEEIQLAALRLISALAEDDHVAVQFVASGAISSLRSLLSAEDDPLLLATKAIAALALHSSCRPLLSATGCIEELQKHQSADSTQLKEYVELALSRLQAMAA